MEGADGVAELQREREGEGEEAKRVTTARVEKRGGGAKWKNLRFPVRGGDRTGNERVYGGGGNLRQEAWSVRRSHPTAFHREATLIADVLEATMDVGHDDCSETYVGGGWKDATWSIRRIFIFLTLSLTLSPVLVPTSSSHSHPSILPYGRTSFFASRHLCRNEAAALFFFLSRTVIRLVSFLKITRNENRTMMTRQ